MFRDLKIWLFVFIVMKFKWADDINTMSEKYKRGRARAKWAWTKMHSKSVVILVSNLHGRLCWRVIYSETTYPKIFWIDCSPNWELHPGETQSPAKWKTEVRGRPPMRWTDISNITDARNVIVRSYPCSAGPRGIEEPCPPGKLGVVVTLWRKDKKKVYRKQAPHSMSQRRMVLSLEPLTTSRSRYCRHAIPRLWPFSVRTNSHELVFHTWPTHTKSLFKRVQSSRVTTQGSALKNSLNATFLICYSRNTTNDLSINFLEIKLFFKSLITQFEKLSW